MSIQIAEISQRLQKALDQNYNVSQLIVLQNFECFPFFDLVKFCCIGSIQKKCHKLFAVLNTEMLSASARCILTDDHMMTIKYPNE